MIALAVGIALLSASLYALYLVLMKLVTVLGWVFMVICSWWVFRMIRGLWIRRAGAV